MKKLIKRISAAIDVGNRGRRPVEKMSMRVLEEEERRASIRFTWGDGEKWRCAVLEVTQGGESDWEFGVDGLVSNSQGRMVDALPEMQYEASGDLIAELWAFVEEEAEWEEAE